MPIKLKWPRAFLATISALIVLGVAGAVLAEGGEGPPGSAVGVHPAPPGQLLERVTEEEVAFALAVLNDSPRVDLISGDQPLQVGTVGPDHTNGQKTGVRIEVYWDRPVASSGPWTLSKCRGTRIQTAEAPWEDLTGVTARVTLATGEIRTLGPGGGGRGSGLDGSSSPRGRPVNTGAPTVFEEKCPPGLESD